MGVPPLTRAMSIFESDIAALSNRLGDLMSERADSPGSSRRVGYAVDPTVQKG